MGNSNVKAKDRKKVTTATFQHRHYGGRLDQSDLICIQEMTCNPSKRTAKQYLPLAENYGVAKSKEPSGYYNAVYFNNEMFDEIAAECLDPAYEQMELKRQCYEYIERGGDDRITEAESGNLAIPKRSNLDSDAFKEVLRECKKVGFYESIAKYYAPKEMETKPPRGLLKRRMAICVLKIKSRALPRHYLVVISLHNYSKASGRKAPVNYACLLFDFLHQLHHTDLKNYIVIIAGDFNFDISDCEDLTQYLSSYYIPDYDLRPLRKTMIDFIVVTKCVMNPSKLDTLSLIDVENVKAHDLKVPEEVKERHVRPKDITNHSPVSAEIVIPEQ